jgi:hypothetical protein
LKFDTCEQYQEYGRRGWIQPGQDVHIRPDGIRALQGYKALNPPPTRMKPW